MLKLDYPYYNKEIQKKVSNILKTGRVNYWTGNECKEFEREFSNYIKVKYAVSLSNGSVALEIALRALKLKKYDEVIVSPRSFVISASCVINLGLKPVFADVDNNGNLNINGIKKVYNKKVKAIIIVHLNGISCEINPILNFVKQKKLFLIEDCSQAHGAIYKNKKVGSFGHIATWSFCQDKIISTGGEGGMISTNYKKLWSRIWSLKDHGKSYNSVYYKNHKTGFKWLHDHEGSNYRMTEIQASIGREQLKYLDKQIEKRNFIVNLYLNELKDYFEKFKIFEKPDFKCDDCPLKKNLNKCKKCKHAFYRLNFYINKIKVNQISLIDKLNKKGVSSTVGPCPEIYREKLFKKLKFFPKKRLSNAKLLGEKSLAIPINPYKSLRKIGSEIKLIKEILNRLI